MTQEVAAAPKFVDYFGRKVLIELCKSTSQFETAAKGRLHRFVSCGRAFLSTGDGISEAGEIGGARWCGSVKIVSTVVYASKKFV